MRIDSEQLAYWYLRLNGFLTIPNFIVHPEKGNAQRTDVDIIGLRFPFREELKGMVDDEVFSRYSEKPVVAIAEVKIGQCNLNDPWTDPQKRNIQGVLRAIGAFREEMVEEVANNIYERGVYDDNQYTVLFVCIGKDENQELAKKYCDVPQITWQQVSRFIYCRFKSFKDAKVSHGQWDDVGKELWTCVASSKDQSDFHSKIG